MKENQPDIKLDELIMVESPYCILQDLKLEEDGSITAKVFNEYQPSDEGGPIAGAEFGRHIAILGSIALANALQHNHSHYFLAVRANIKREIQDAYRFDELKLYAKPMKLEKRKGKIYGEIYGRNNELVNTAKVDYMILEREVFSKVYERHKKENSYQNKVSPYIKRRHLTNIVIDGHTARAEFGTILKNECEGHFRDFPALPVALIGGLFGELGYQLFKHNLPGFDTIISPRTDIKAHGLVFSGEHLHFAGRISQWISDEAILITAEALVGDDVVADVSFILKGVKQEKEKGHRKQQLKKIIRRYNPFSKG
ncbi:hypothetical protein [Sunxiuqinia dokdonensis]|uniref:Uncharacterized protein n=1 Tax=Sunxiuqinia dokdonensis TaxID=1409788 RepID=A0A0L8V4K6_9BACT|nr:hypothetical protein [Sunxiuqinia dokdonensis]KOH43425.1 hypothetical protein NC99_37660 [Sunxiuqinia dokdonensis]